MKWTTRACNGQRHVAGFPWRLSASDESLAISVAGPFVAAADVNVMRAASVSLGSVPAATGDPARRPHRADKLSFRVGPQRAAVGQDRTLTGCGFMGRIRPTADSRALYPLRPLWDRNQTIVGREPTYSSRPTPVTRPPAMSVCSIRQAGHRIPEPRTRLLKDRDGVAHQYRADGKRTASLSPWRCRTDRR